MRNEEPTNISGLEHEQLLSLFDRERTNNNVLLKA